MTRVVLDTNVVVSVAVSTDGNPALISADYIISGDEHLLKLQEFKGIRIVSPAEFVKLMAGAK